VHGRERLRPVEVGLRATHGRTRGELTDPLEGDHWSWIAWPDAASMLEAERGMRASFDALARPSA
jgi:hypothetical protein